MKSNKFTLYNGIVVFIFCWAVEWLTAAESIPPAGDNIQINTAGQALTEAAIVEMTLSNSRKLRSMSTNVDIAGYRLKSARNIPNPEIRINDLTEDSYARNFDETRIGYA
jgi:hypothetical protein